jgi:hypothetical protein
MITLRGVQAALSPYELNPGTVAAILGPTVVPLLAEVAGGSDPHLAARAVSVAACFDMPEARHVIADAAHSSAMPPRMAAAAALARLAVFPEDLAVSLLGDEDPGVRQWALESVDRASAAGLLEHVRKMATGDPEPYLRRMAERVASRVESAL